MGYEYETHVKEALARIKGKTINEIYVHGRNPNIETNYQVWLGSPNWLKYRYRLPRGNYQEATLKTLNIPRQICRLWANNYANEDTVVTIPNKNSNKRLQEVFVATNLMGRFNNFCEMFMGLGIGGMTVEVEALIDEKGVIHKSDSELQIKTIAGRRIVPITVEDGEVIECAFYSFFTGGARITIHYLDDKTNTYNIAIVKATGANNQYKFDYDNIEVIPTGAPKDTPLFTIWQPNLTEEDELDKSVGTSVFSTAFDTFKQLDLGYTAYYKEVKLGQKVKFISADITQVDANGNVVPFDEEDESVMFVPDGTDAGTKMQEFNGELRIDAITKYINTNLNCAAMLCGLGQTHFEFEGSGGRPIQTATGVIAKQTELYRNVIKQENFATGKFRQLVMAIAYMNNTFTTNPTIQIKSKADIQIIYDDNLVEDTASKKQAELAEVNAGVMTIAEFRSHWYDESEEDALAFVQEHGMLLDKYILALQSNVITPEIFVDLVFGENYKNRKVLVDYITSNYSQKKEEVSNNTGFEDENENEDEDDE